MLVELTPKQADLINEALGLALQALPASQRVAIAAMDYAPILQAIQNAAQQKAAATELQQTDE